VDKKKFPKLLEIIPALRRKWEEYSPPIALMSKLNGKCPSFRGKAVQFVDVRKSTHL
jgi:hypothetical protein